MKKQKQLDERISNPKSKDLRDKQHEPKNKADQYQYVPGPWYKVRVRTLEDGGVIRIPGIKEWSATKIIKQAIQPTRVRRTPRRS